MNMTYYDPSDLKFLSKIKVLLEKNKMDHNHSDRSYFDLSSSFMMNRIMISHIKDCLHHMLDGIIYHIS